jgi:hypothetical protein
MNLALRLVQMIVNLAVKKGSIHIQRATMHCQGIACTESFDMGLTPAEGQKLECFKWTPNNTFIIALEITLCNKIMPVFCLTQALSMQRDQKIRKNRQFFSKKLPKKLPSQKKAKNIYNKAQFESPKHLQQTTFETFKVAELAKNRSIWSPCLCVYDLYGCQA